MGHPAKEGLRPSHRFRTDISLSTQSGSSSKRGIKTLITDATNMNNTPRVGHPAKEGLRPLGATPGGATFHRPRVGHPAKEGLRLGMLSLFPFAHRRPEWVIQQKRD